MDIPCYIINLDKDNDRWNRSYERILKAGFTNIIRFKGVDTTIFPKENYTEDETNSEERELIYNNWKYHNVKFDYKKIWAHPTGCMLSHLNLWKYIIDNNIQKAVIFEDDVLFHREWDTLFYKYLEWTPTDYELVFMGHHCGNISKTHPIVICPVYCLNAYIVTLEGTKKLYDMIVNYPYEETHAIDMMLVYLMRKMISENNINLKWYVWNTEMFPDEEAMKKIHPHLVEKDKGLVFQEYFLIDK